MVQAKAMGQVAVIIAAYRAADTIARAVRSALAQPEVAELVVVDDASGDVTAAQALAADDGSGRLKILTQPTNTGPSAARNRAIAASSAPWLCVLDADDFFLPGRIAGLLIHASSQDFIADDVWQVQHDAVDGPRRNLLEPPLSQPIAVDFEMFVRGNISRRGRNRGELGFIKPLIRRAFLKTHGLQFQEQMRLGEDYELYARALALGGKMLLVPAQGYIAVIRPGSLSALHSPDDLRHLRDADRALMRDIFLPPASLRVLRRHATSIDCRLQWRLLIIAKKTRDVPAALRSFAKPPRVVGYLLAQLWRHFFG